jgi:hypothetical protein
MDITYFLLSTITGTLVMITTKKEFYHLFSEYKVKNTST